MRRRQAMLLCAVCCAWLTCATRADETRRATPTAPAEYLARQNPIGSDPQVLADARAIYDRECKKCHGADGRGRGSATRGMRIKPPDYTDAIFMKGRSDGQLLWIILNGSDPDTTEMAGFKNKLTELDVWKLVHLIREFARRQAFTAQNENESEQERD